LIYINGAIRTEYTTLPCPLKTHPAIKKCRI